MKRRGWAGYTIVEVMIVLAVSGALFTAAAFMFSGRQGQTEFTQSVRDFESHIQTIANDVANGYYPYASGSSCTADPLSNSSPSVNAGGGAGSGTNSGCIYIGKMMNVQKDSFDALTIVGRQFKPAPLSGDVTSLDETKPVVVPNVAEKYVYKYDLTISKIVKTSDTSKQFESIGFLEQLGDGSGGLATGSRSVQLYGIVASTSPSTVDNATIASTVAASSSNLVVIDGGVTICLVGGNGKNAEVTVGVGDSQTATNVLIDTGVTSECS